MTKDERAHVTVEHFDDRICYLCIANICVRNGILPQTLNVRATGARREARWKDRERADMREREAKQSGGQKQGRLKEGILYDCMQQTMVNPPPPDDTQYVLML